MPDESPARRAVRQELLRIRDRAGFSSRALAERIGVGRETMRRFDKGVGPIRLSVVADWLDVCGVAGQERELLMARAEHALGQTRPWRELLGPGGAGHLQDPRPEREASLVRNYQPSIMPGLLQTPEYARLVFTQLHTTDVDAALTARLGRQQALTDGRAKFVFLIAERVLYASLGDGRVLAAQLDRLLSLMAFDPVTIGVVPDSAPVIAWHNFIVWTPAGGGDPYVTAELVAGLPGEIVEPADVATFTDLWDRLDVSAAHGEEAARLIRRARG